MGGANAGEVLSEKSDVFNDKNTSQVSFLYFADLNDDGDFGNLAEVLKDFNFAMIPTRKKSNGVVLGNMPHYRSFRLNNNGLYIEDNSGVLYEKKTYPLEKDYTHITSDKRVAKELFERIQELPKGSKGRDLFLIYAISHSLNEL